MIFNLPKRPDGTTPEAISSQRLWDAVAWLMQQNSVAGVATSRTTKGTFEIAQASVSGGLPVQSVGPLDQAIFVTRPIPPMSPEGTKAKTYFYGVRGGYIYRLSAGGRLGKSARFTAPCFGESSICYDNVNDKIICSFWNEFRADDSGFVETENAKKLYKINPDSLLVEASAAVISGAHFDTQMLSGPHKLLFFNGKVYVVVWGQPSGHIYNIYIFRVKPDTLAPDTGAIPELAIINLNAPWTDITIDAVGGFIWWSDSTNQQVSSLLLSDFATRVDYFTNTTPTNPGSGVVATVTCDVYRKNLDNSFHIANFGSFPSGYYLFEWESGVMEVKDPLDGSAGKYFAGEFQRVPPAGAIEHDFNPVLNGVISGSALGITSTPYDTAKAVRDANDGRIVGPSLDTFGLGSVPFGVISHLFADYPYDGATTFPGGTTVVFDDGRGTTDPDTGLPNTDPYVTVVWRAVVSTLGVTPCDRTYSLQAWTSTFGYFAGQFVLRTGTRYKAVHDNINDDPLAGSGNWSSQSPLYNPGDFLVDGGNEYQCLHATNDEPPSSNWTIVGIASWQRVLNVVENYSFSLYQSFTYGDTPTPYNPYGIAWVPTVSRLYATTRTNIVLILNPADSTFRLIDLGELSVQWDSITAFSQGDISTFNGVKYQATLPSTNKEPDTNPTYWTTTIDRTQIALPYHIVYDSVTDKLYLPLYRSNRVVVLDPQTNQIAIDVNNQPIIVKGFDSPFDVAFARRQDPAHPDDPTKQLSSPFAVQHGSVGIKAIPVKLT